MAPLVSRPRQDQDSRPSLMSLGKVMSRQIRTAQFWIIIQISLNQPQVKSLHPEAKRGWGAHLALGQQCLDFLSSQQESIGLSPAWGG